LSSYIFQANPTKHQVGKPHFRHANSYGIFKLNSYRGHPMFNGNSYLMTTDSEFFRLQTPTAFDYVDLDDRVTALEGNPMNAVASIGGHPETSVVADATGVASYAFFNDYSSYFLHYTKEGWSDHTAGDNVLLPNFDSSFVLGFNLLHSTDGRRDKPEEYKEANYTPDVGLNGIIGEFLLPVNAGYFGQLQDVGQNLTQGGYWGRDYNTISFSQILNLAYRAVSKYTASKYVIRIPKPSAAWVGKEFTVSVPAYTEETQANPFLGVWSESRKALNTVDYFSYFFPAFWNSNTYGNHATHSPEGGNASIHGRVIDPQTQTLSEISKTKVYLRYNYLTAGAAFTSTTPYEYSNESWIHTHNAIVNFNETDMVIPGDVWSYVPERFSLSVGLKVTRNSSSPSTAWTNASKLLAPDETQDIMRYQVDLGSDNELVLRRNFDVFYDIVGLPDLYFKVGNQQSIVSRANRKKREEDHDADINIVAPYSYAYSFLDTGTPKESTQDMVVDNIYVKNVREGVSATYTCILLDNTAVKPDREASVSSYKWIKVK